MNKFLENKSLEESASLVVQDTNLITKDEKYNLLVEQIGATITEAVHNSKWMLIEGHWGVGELIRKYFTEDITRLLQDLAVDVGISERTLWYCVQAYDKYPDINQIPEGKNISWNKLITKYLPEPKENKIDIPIPQGKYSTIVIDPPWPMEFIGREVRPNQVDMPYSTMSIEQIRKFPINDFAFDVCNLFLWTTHRFLPDALEIIKEWGFNYHVLLTWDKQNGMTLFGFHRCTEFIIYAYKGKLSIEIEGDAFPTIFSEKAREHSRKPDTFYELVKEKTQVPRIDIFSREKREGFDQYGDQTNKFK